MIAAITGSGGYAYVIYWLTIWLAGGMGMLLLARHLRAPAWGGLVVALGFVFSGFYTGHAEHTSVVYSHSLLPFIIWRLDVAMVRRKFLPAAQAGALWGLSALAGYPALTIFTVALIICWAVSRCVAAEKGERVATCRYAIALTTTVGVIGVAVLLPCYASAAYEASGYSDRSMPLTRNFALTSNAFQPAALASLSSPALVTIVVDEFERDQRTLWVKTDVSSVDLYTGTLTLVLALVALTGAKERRWRWSLLGITLLALACTMSDTLPLRGWLYDLIPPTRYFRHSAMLRGYTLFLLSVLAILGTRDLASWRTDSGVLKRFAIIGPIVAIISGVTFAIVLSGAAIRHSQPALAIIHTAILQGGLVMIAIALRRGLTSTGPILPALLVGLALFDGLATIHFTEGTLFNQGARPNFPVASDTSVELGPQKFARALGSARVNANLFFKVPTLKNYAPFRNRFHEMIITDPALQVMALGSHRVWFAADAPEVAPTKEVFAHFVRRWAELEAPLFVRHSREQMLEPSPATSTELAAIANTPSAISVESKIISYMPDELMLEMTAPMDGWLMVTDRWSRSWHASVNGIEQPISGANFIFRAVPVKQGTNRIEFSFQPLGMPGLVIFSWSILGVILAFSLARLPLRRPSLTSAISPALLPATE